MMRRLTFMALVACVTVPRSAVAQSLMRRVMSDPDGSVHFAFASRPGVCGDGATYLRDGFGGTGRIYQGGNFSGHMRDDDDDDLRISAVFALSQQPKDVAVPQLISLARHNTHPAVRAQAVFWLGQSHDPRALDLFEEILRTR